jgi:hypothetical protein
MFDAPYSDYNWISDKQYTSSSDNLWVYPNPCTSILTLSFEVERMAQVRIFMYDIIGTPMKKIVDQQYTTGTHSLKCDVSDFSPGIYIITYRINDIIGTSKVLLSK